jgi:hypothetical protein
VPSTHARRHDAGEGGGNARSIRSEAKDQAMKGGNLALV